MHLCVLMYRHVLQAGWSFFLHDPQVVRLDSGKGRGGAGGWFPSPSHMSIMLGLALRDLWTGLPAGFLKAHTLCCHSL